MKNLKGIIYYGIIIIIAIFSINYFMSKKAFLNYELSNLKAKTFQIEKMIEKINK